MMSRLKNYLIGMITSDKGAIVPVNDVRVLFKKMLDVEKRLIDLEKRLADAERRLAECEHIVSTSEERLLPHLNVLAARVGELESKSKK